MKQLGKLSYYYTLAAVTGLLIGSIFFVPPPFNYFQVALLGPAILFMFLNITHPEHVSDSEWSARLLIIFLFIAVAVIAGYYLSYNAQGKERELMAQISDQETKQKTIDDLSNEVETLKQQLADQETLNDDEPKEDDDKLDNQQVSDLLQYLGVNDESSSSTDTYTKIIGYVKLKDGSTEADVFKEDNPSSRVVGIITSTTTYPFYQSKGEWYLIEFDASQKGWVKAQYVKEQAKPQ